MSPETPRLWTGFGRWCSGICCFFGDCVPSPSLGHPVPSTGGPASGGLACELQSSRTQYRSRKEKKGWPRAGCEVASGLGWGWGPCLRSPYLVLAASAAPVGGHTTRDKLPPSFLLWHGLRVPPPDLTVDSNFVPLLSGSGRTTDSLNTHTDKLEKGEEGMGPLEQRTTIIPGTLGD